MALKRTMTISKAWSDTGISGFLPAGFIARLKNALKFDIPIGYQDETGFHTGVKPDEKEIKWPATW
jgi:hypothetical protein